MSRLRTSLLAWIAAALLTCAAAPATAQKAGPAPAASAETAPSAQSLYEAAQKLFDKGSYAEALVAFRQAYNASSSPNARLMIAQCLLGLGRSADAYEEMTATRSESDKRAAAEPKYLKTRDAADAQIALLEPRVAKLVLELPASAPVDVAINGSRVARDRLGTPIAVDPGTVVITAARSDGAVAQQERELRAGETTHITVTFPDPPKKPDAKVAPPAKTPAPAPENPPLFGTVRAAGLAVAGVGVAGVAVFAIAGGLAQSRYSQLEDRCGGQRCTDPAEADAVDSGRTLSTVSTVGLVAGLAGLAGGGVMILLGGPASPSPPAPTGLSVRRITSNTYSSLPSRATITVSPAGAGLRITATF